MRNELRQALKRVERRMSHVKLWNGLAVCWLAFSALLLFALQVVSYLGSPPIPGRWLLGLFTVALATGLVWTSWALRPARDLRLIARRIEAKYPELGTGLLAAVEQVAASPSERLGFLQTAVIRDVVAHSRSHDWNETVPTRRLRVARVAHAAALAVLLLVSSVLLARPYLAGNDRARTRLAADAGEVQIEPGDADIERGTSLLVVARFPTSVPSDASLVVTESAGSEGRRAMARSLEDPTFAGRVESIDADLSYRVEFDGQRSRTFHVGVFEYPELKRADAKLVFPRFTAMAPKTVEDIRHVTAVEGTELTLLCRLNKDVASAKLVDDQNHELVLAPASEGSHVYQATVTLSDPRRYRIRLVDRDGRSNKLPSEIVANVTRNHPPVVTMVQPAHDVRVSPIEELKLNADLEDDFGLVRQGMTYALPGGASREIVLAGSIPLSRRVRAERLLDFEALQAAPDQLVTYFFWAEDLGPDNQPRRTSGDMYFAEVRHFEEIFRQGEQPPGGSSADQDQGGNGQESERLAELQKEIINGTWKLIRRETGSKPTETFVADSQVLLDSQRSAIQQAAQLSGRLQDKTSKGYLEKASQLMQEAERRLAVAVQKSSTAEHPPALAAEQAAYQALLKLRAREFQVIRGTMRGRSARGMANGASQRQLNQLELRNDENRYEEQSRARSQQSERERTQRETRQVLNRLRELAQRQLDLNERLKELQSALEAAKTEQARREIERQLKRLREQEQQILHDADELRERMEREENRDRMAEERQQMEQGREHVRQASEALEAGRVSQALTEGTRAGRQLNDLKEQIRKKASNRFADELTEMRTQARRLDEEQVRLSEQLEVSSRDSRRSLRDGGEREQIRQGLGEQQKRLDQLLERMRATVQDAEETEPLLAKSLYDTERKANEAKVPDALKVAEQLVKLGVVDDAAKAARHAAAGTAQLREGVERAARSVLGDETAALKLAQGELEDLTRELDREIARSTGAEPPGQSRQRNRGREQEQSASQSSAQQARDRQRAGVSDQPRSKGQEVQERKGSAGATDESHPAAEDVAQPGQPRPGDSQGREGQQRPRSLRGSNDARQRRPDHPLEGVSTGPGGPVTGEGFRRWQDRMRDVEELLEEPEMRAGVARARDRVRGEREELKRHAKEPDWNKLRELVVQPLDELRQRIAEEVKRRESPNSLVPIDRDPVPPQFAERVRRYYERLGSGR
jgi:hypothetical protein